MSTPEEQAQQQRAEEEKRRKAERDAQRAGGTAARAPESRDDSDVPSSTPVGRDDLVSATENPGEPARPYVPGDEGFPTQTEHGKPGTGKKQAQEQHKRNIERTEQIKP